MDPRIYLFLHLIAVIHLVGLTFYAFAGPSTSTRKLVLAVGGVASILAVATGLILVMKMGAFPGWVWLKLLAWLGLSAFAGIAYRRRGLSRILMFMTVVLVVMALWAVTFKPF